MALKNGSGSQVMARYAYDALGRLTQTQDGLTATPIETYAYDSTGNRTSLKTAGGASLYTYPATSHHLTAVDGVGRDHDASGNTVRVEGKEYVYNDANRMAAVKQDGNLLEGYAYNHLGSAFFAFRSAVISRSPSMTKPGNGWATTLNQVGRSRRSGLKTIQWH